MKKTKSKPRKATTGRRKPSTRKAAPRLLAEQVSAGCSQKVLACIGRQSGGRDLSGNPTLGAVGVQGFLLAGCLNETFGLTPPDAFRASDFPSTMTVEECIQFVCRTVDG